MYLLKLGQTSMWTENNAKNCIRKIQTKTVNRKDHLEKLEIYNACKKADKQSWEKRERERGGEDKQIWQASRQERTHDDMKKEKKICQEQCGVSDYYGII